MKTLKTIVISVSITAMLSCSKTEETAAPKAAGYFALSQAAINNRVEANENGTIDFDLGDVRASKSYLFILNNGGDYDISSVQFHTDNPNFILSPKSISVLKAKGMGLTQIVSLDVVHGKAINGSFIASLLSKNDNFSYATISGTTQNTKGENITISTIVKFKVSAKIMDMKILEYGNEIRLDTNFGTVGSSLGGLGNLRNHWVKDSKFKIVNSGNVPFTLKYGTENNGNFSNSIELAINGEVEISLPNVLNSLFFEFDGANTTTNDKRIQLGNNGKGYLNVLRIPDVTW
ncbi:MAG: hypothetical protein EAZ27_00035 [Cytophagales bacterium]|nr:MAG: hypothetical protein EAZ27_00035 [Cytophagales bacterium]